VPVNPLVNRVHSHIYEQLTQISQNLFRKNKTWENDIQFKELIKNEYFRIPENNKTLPRIIP